MAGRMRRPALAMNGFLTLLLDRKGMWLKELS